MPFRRVELRVGGELSAQRDDLWIGVISQSSTQRHRNAAHAEAATVVGARFQPSSRRDIARPASELLPTPPIPVSTTPAFLLNSLNALFVIAQHTEQTA